MSYLKEIYNAVTYVATNPLDVVTSMYDTSRNTLKNLNPQPESRIDSAKHKLSMFTHYEIQELSKKIHISYDEPNSQESQRIWNILKNTESSLKFDLHDVVKKIFNFLDINGGQRSEVVLLTTIEELFNATSQAKDSINLGQNPGFWRRYKQNSIRNINLNKDKAHNIGFFTGSVTGFVFPAITASTLLVSSCGLFGVIYVLHFTAKGLFDTLTRKKHDVSRIKNALDMLIVFNKDEVLELQGNTINAIKTRRTKSDASKELFKKINSVFCSPENFLKLIQAYLTETTKDSRGDPICLTYAGRGTYNTLLEEIEKAYKQLDNGRKLLCATSYSIMPTGNSTAQLFFTARNDVARMRNCFATRNLSQVFGRKECLDAKRIQQNENELWSLELTFEEFNYIFGAGSFESLLSKNGLENSSVNPVM